MTDKYTITADVTDMHNFAIAFEPYFESTAGNFIWFKTTDKDGNLMDEA